MWYLKAFLQVSCFSVWTWCDLLCSVPNKVDFPASYFFNFYRQWLFYLPFHLKLTLFSFVLFFGFLRSVYKNSFFSLYISIFRSYFYLTILQYNNLCFSWTKLTRIRFLSVYWLIIKRIVSNLRFKSYNKEKNTWIEWMKLKLLIWF